MDCASTPETVARMDAGTEPPRTGSWRVSGVDAQSMARC